MNKTYKIIISYTDDGISIKIDSLKICENSNNIEHFVLGKHLVETIKNIRESYQNNQERWVFGEI